MENEQRLQEVEKILDEFGIEHWRESCLFGNPLLKKVTVKACDIGDGIYNYGDEAVEPTIDNPNLKILLEGKDDYFQILPCYPCCGCGDW